MWAPAYLRRSLGLASATHTPITRLSAQHRLGLRTLLHVPVEMRTTVLYAATMRFPLEVLLAKASWRYYTRVESLASSQDPPPVGLLAQWGHSIPPSRRQGVL